jgi:hypothetical protein
VSDSPADSGFDPETLAIPDEPLPVSVLTGFLGSGKTTVLRHLLGHPAMEETAVVINEFGEIGLDHLLVEKADEDTVLLNSGCLCCTVRGDLIATLRDLFKRRVKREVPAFARLVIETTGLADPAPILHTLMNDPLLVTRFRLDGVIATRRRHPGPARGGAEAGCRRRPAADHQDRPGQGGGGRGTGRAARRAQPGGPALPDITGRNRAGQALRRRALRPGDQKPRRAPLAQGRGLRGPEGARPRI